MTRSSTKLSEVLIPHRPVCHNRQKACPSLASVFLKAILSDGSLAALLRFKSRSLTLASVISLSAVVLEQDIWPVALALVRCTAVCLLDRRVHVMSAGALLVHYKCCHGAVA